jgi:hypothetical protein
MPDPEPPAIWFCCHCHFGPYTKEIYVMCIKCDHRLDHCCMGATSDSDQQMENPISAHPKPPTSCSHSHHDDTPLIISQASSSSHHLHPPPLSLQKPTANAAVHRNNSELYMCCGCGDGPKVWTIQPQCIICDHIACGSCIPVKN